MICCIFVVPGGALVSSSRDISGPQMAPPLPSQPEWEARLIMPKDMWPNRPKDYTVSPANTRRWDRVGFGWASLADGGPT